jgi:hypothetical protein
MTTYPEERRETEATVAGARVLTTPDPAVSAPPGVPGIEDLETPGARPAGTGNDRSTAAKATDAVGTAASDVGRTVKRDASRLAAEAGDQARRVAREAGYKANERLGHQQKQWSDKLGDVSRELREMVGDRADRPAGKLVNQLADRTSMLADYVGQSQPRDVLAQVQAFARRRPGAFLAAMVAAGFVVGRLGKSVAMREEEGGEDG